MKIHASPEMGGRVRVPGDKSITHRALMLAAICQGVTVIRRPGTGADNLSTLAAIRALGVDATFDDTEHFTVRGVGMHGLRAPEGPVDCGNSGTTARLLAGLLAGAGVEATLTGDASLSARPMRRIAAPLSALGYTVETGDASTLPLQLGRAPSPPPALWDDGCRVEMTTASAQVKSCILLSGLYRPTATEVIETFVTRDHTERMLRAYGVRCVSSAHYARPRDAHEGAPDVQLFPPTILTARPLDIPGDPSSAAFLHCGAALTGVGVMVDGCGINPTRVAYLDVLRRMGAEIQIRSREQLSSGEPAASVGVGRAALKATTIAGPEIPLLIDEIPALCVVGAASTGRFEVRDAAELRVKESDRITTTIALLRALGVTVDERPDGLAFDGLGACTWGAFEMDSHGDHRIGLAAAIAGLAGRGGCVVHGADAIGVSYPHFADTLLALGARCEI